MIYCDIKQNNLLLICQICGHSGFATIWDIDTGNLKYALNTKHDVYSIKQVDSQVILISIHSSIIGFGLEYETLNS